MSKQAADGTKTPVLNLKGFRILAWASFMLLNILYLLACLQRTAIPGAVFNDIQSDLGLLGSEVTRIGTIYVYVYAVTQVLAGMLVDRYGGKSMGILGGLFMGVGLFLFGKAETTPILYLSRIITAIGQSFIYLCVCKIAHILFTPKQFGGLIGLSMAIGFSGGILGTMPTQFCAQFVGWRPLFTAIGLCCIASSVIIVFALRKFHERPRESGKVTLQSLKNLLNEPGRFCFMTFDFWTYPAYFVIQTVLGQKFIQDYLGYSATAAATFTMLLTLGSVITCLAGTPMMRVTRQRRLPLVWISKLVPVLVALVMILGIYFRMPAWCFLLCFVLMSANHISSAAQSALMCEITDTKTIAFTSAVRNMFPYIGAGIVGGICGIILDHYTPAEILNAATTGIIHYPKEAYMACLGVMFVFGLIGFLFTLRIPETRGKNIYNSILKQ